MPSGWWYTYPSEKYESVNGKDYPLYYGKIKIHVWNHQPAMFFRCILLHILGIILGLASQTGVAVAVTVTQYNKCVAKCDVVCPSSAIWATVGDVSWSHLNP